MVLRALVDVGRNVGLRRGEVCRAGPAQVGRDVEAGGHGGVRGDVGGRRGREAPRSEARIRNKEQEEQRLLKLLAEATGKLKDVLEVEREVSRVRGEVEQLKGRLRVLGDLTTLTTVELRIDEVKGYVPEESPSYGTRMRRAFQGSLASLVATAQGLSIAIAALTPWLVVLGVAAGVVVLAIRRATRRRRG